MITGRLREFLQMYLHVEIHSDVTLFAILIYLAVVLLLIVLRLVVNIGYQTQYSLFKACAKPIKEKKDIKDTKSALLNRVIQGYAQIAERGVQNISALSIAQNQVNQFHFLGWRFASIEKFVINMEGMLLFVAIALALFMENKDFLAMMGILSFIIIRLLASIEDFTFLKEKLTYDLTQYVEREIGQFYAVNIATTIQMLKLELKGMIRDQSLALSETIDKLGANVSGVLQLSMQEMTKNVENTMQNVTGFGEFFTEPMKAWKITLTEAEKVQQALNQSFEKINRSTENLEDTTKVLADSFAEQNENLTKYSHSIGGQIQALSEIATQLEKNTDHHEVVLTAVKDSLQYVQNNQVTLEKSMQTYELVLESLTAKMGNGFGSMIQLHMESAYSSFADVIQDNISKIARSNGEIAIRLETLFAQLADQSKNETQAIVRVYEQLDMHNQMKSRAHLKNQE